MWFTLTSFTSDFGLSLVDYFPLIPKVHKIAVVSVAIYTFRNNYPSAVDNLLFAHSWIWTFALFKKEKKKNNKTKIFKIQHEVSDRCSKHGIYTLPGGVVG